MEVWFKVCNPWGGIWQLIEMDPLSVCWIWRGVPVGVTTLGVPNTALGWKNIKAWEQATDISPWWKVGTESSSAWMWWTTSSGWVGLLTSMSGLTQVEFGFNLVGVLVWLSSSSLTRKSEISASSAENTCLVVWCHHEDLWHSFASEEKVEIYQGSCISRTNGTSPVMRVLASDLCSRRKQKFTLVSNLHWRSVAWKRGLLEPSCAGMAVSIWHRLIPDFSSGLPSSRIIENSHEVAKPIQEDRADWQAIRADTSHY